MKSRIVRFGVLVALAAIPTLVGCEREISRSKTTTVEKDGTVKTEEERVTRAPDGSVTKEESSSRKTPPESP